MAHHEEANARFIREAQAAAALDHPNICAIQEVGEADGLAYIAMAYIEGKTLRERIAQKPLETGDALRLSEFILDSGDAFKFQRNPQKTFQYNS